MNYACMLEKNASMFHLYTYFMRRVMRSMIKICFIKRKKHFCPARHFFWSIISQTVSIEEHV
jgi:hypothetical protein